MTNDAGQEGHAFEGAPVVTAYTRAAAIRDGLLVDVTETAREAGLGLPTAVTRAIWDDCVAWTDEDRRRSRSGGGQDEDGRLWDLLHLAHYSVTQAANEEEAVGDSSRRVLYDLHRKPRPGRGRKRRVAVKLVIGPGDTAEPVITILEPNED